MRGIKQQPGQSERGKNELRLRSACFNYIAEVGFEPARLRWFYEKRIISHGSETGFGFNWNISGS